MSIIDSIFKALEGPTNIARATGDPVQTVHSWKAKQSIPPWRRPQLLDAARRLEKELSPEAIAYLASADRKVDAAA